MAALLDVNVLVALFDPDHVHHRPAHDRLAESRRAGWATCPLTENGLVRILSNPSYSDAEGRRLAKVHSLFRRHTLVPMLRLSGTWLADAGFAQGQELAIEARQRK